MAEKVPTKPNVDRVLRLSEVKVLRRNVKKTPCFVVDSDGHVGETRRLAVDLITRVTLAQGHAASHPTHLMVIDSAAHPGQVACVPMMSPGEDHLEVQWSEKGRLATINLARLLTLKQIVIPAGTRMIIEVYPETDPDFGPVIGMKLHGAPCVPKRTSKARR